MHYAKSKREKVSECNICRQVKGLSWDHVPPKGGIELSPVQMQTILQLFTGEPESQRLRESQNGMKFRTICSDCNSYLGSQFDPVINDFATSVGKYLNTTLAIPEIISHEVRPQRLMKAIVGHLLAAKVNLENTHFDQIARQYVLDINAPLPPEINIFYWPYPYNCSICIRDFGMFTPRGTFREPAIFQTLKYFPIAYLCCDKPEYADLECLSSYRDAGIDDAIQIPINLQQIKDRYWPEAPSDEENNIFFGGQSAANSVHVNPRN